MTPVQAPANPVAVPFAAGLARFGDRPALIAADGVVSYGELARLVAATSIELGAARRLVHVPITADIASIASYLACLAGGHPVLLTAPGSPVAATYEPDITIAGDSIQVHRVRPVHELHPELGLLLSTSGSTGSPKLVRLSRQNVQANAESIAQALRIRPDDRAVTSLPLHYCYGLSVLHSHLLVAPPSSSRRCR